MTDPADRLVWVDLETTGRRRADKEKILEVACLVTEADLTPVDDGFTTVIHVDQWRLAQMPRPVWDMHSKSGLIDDVLRSTVTLEAAGGQVLAYVAERVPAGVVPGAGSSVHFDRRFLVEHMPDVEAHLHYRNVDVSSVKELVRRWFPATYARLPARVSRHRAMPDVLASIDELAFYRAEAFSSPVAA